MRKVRPFHGDRSVKMAHSSERPNGQAKKRTSGSILKMILTLGLGSSLSLSGSLGEWRILIKWVLPKLILVALSVGATVFWFYQFGPARGVDNSGQPDRIKDFSFIAPGNQVPSCYTYYGKGKIPDGDEVLVFDRVVDRTHASPLSPYSPDFTVIPESGTGWQVSTDIGTGNPSGTQIELTALLVRSGTVRFLNAVTDQGKPVLSNEGWKTQYLPPSLQEAQPIYVTYNGNSKPCN
jgi:hypothetical protein